MGTRILSIWMDHSETAILARQWHELKAPTLPISGINSFVEQPGLWKASGGILEYFIACPVNTGNAISAYKPAMEYYEKHVKKLGIEPEGYGAVSSYVAVYVLKDAIERAGTLDPEKLVKALEETDYRGPYGRIRFHLRSHQVIPSYNPEEGAVRVWFRWQDGKRVQIWPLTVAAAEIKLSPWIVR